MSELIPQAFREHIRWVYVDQSSRDWFDTLPAVMGEVLEHWQASVDGESRHGAEGIAVPVRVGGQPLMVKFQQPTAAFAEQAQALRDWCGRGMVRLIEADLDRGAMLLERLDDARPFSAEPLDEALVEIGALLRRQAVSPPPGHSYPTTRQLVSDVRCDLVERNQTVGEPLDQPTLTAVLEACDWLLSRDDPGLMVNADLHHDQVLRRHVAMAAHVADAGTEGVEWVAVDPRPMVGDPAHQCPQSLWSLEGRLPLGSSSIRQKLALLSDAAGFDETSARSWTLVRGADYWLWGLANGLTHDPERCRRIIAAVLGR